MVMAAEQGRGIAQDGGLHDFTWMDHAGGQRAHRHGIDADDFIFLVQHRHHEKLAIDVAEVLAKEHSRIPGAADLGLRARQTALAHQRHAIDRDTVRSPWSRVDGGKEALLLSGRCSCRIHTLVSLCWGDGDTGQAGCFQAMAWPVVLLINRTVRAVPGAEPRAAGGSRVAAAYRCALPSRAESLG